MKRLLTTLTALLLVSFLFFTQEANAGGDQVQHNYQQSKGFSNPDHNNYGGSFVDEDGDGKCDYFIDEDGDGICDHCQKPDRPQSRLSKQPSNGNSNSSNGFLQTKIGIILRLFGLWGF